MPPTTPSRVSLRGAVAKTTPSTNSRPQKRPSEARLEAVGAAAGAWEVVDLTNEEDDDQSAGRKQAAPEADVESKGWKHAPARWDDKSSQQPVKTTPSKTSARSPRQSVTTNKSPTGRGTTTKPEEKRLRRGRKSPPSSFLVKLQRARTQRMIVLSRRREYVVEDDLDGARVPCERMEIVGSTGNVYEVTVGRLPTCTCPDAAKGHECKHKVYAMHTVLKAPEHLQYQLALLTSELEEIFAHAPPIPTDVVAADAAAAAVAQDGRDDGSNRKPTDGECPICYMDLDEARNKLVWCRSQCGHNLHKSCFDQWAAASRTAGKQVRCVYCRSPWKSDLDDVDAVAVKRAGVYTADGYVNVADQFGLSRARDYSSYHQPWARRHFS